MLTLLGLSALLLHRVANSVVLPFLSSLNRNPHCYCFRIAAITLQGYTRVNIVIVKKCVWWCHGSQFFEVPVPPGTPRDLFLHQMQQGLTKDETLCWCPTLLKTHELHTSLFKWLIQAGGTQTKCSTPQEMKKLLTIMRSMTADSKIEESSEWRLPYVCLFDQCSSTEWQGF